jgi:hypothetical protein
MDAQFFSIIEKHVAPEDSSPTAQQGIMRLVAVVAAEYICIGVCR